MIKNIINKLMCSGTNCFDENFFINNFRNGVITHCSYDGISMEQNPYSLFSFEKLFRDYEPELVLEIGTFHGGLTLMIRDLLDEINLSNTKVISYDVREPNFLYEKIVGKDVTINVKNLFSSNYQNFESIESENEIKILLNKYEKVIVLCDGGSKKNEFKLMSKLLRPNHIIMAHDYSPNQEYFEKEMINNRWNWMEIQDSDIEEVSIDNKLIQHMFDGFIEVGWVCKIKQNL